MSDPLAPIGTGTVSPLVTSAAAVNAVLDAARAYRQSRGAVPAGGLLDDLFEAATRCLVKWTGGSALTLDPFSVLAYGSPVVSPAADTASRLSAARRPAFEAAAPTDPALPFVVTVRPVQGQKFGLAVTSGLVPVQVDVTDSTHTRAVPVAGITDHLASAAAGGVPVVWKESGTGTKWAFVLLGDPGAATTTASPTYGHSETTSPVMPAMNNISQTQVVALAIPSAGTYLVSAGVSGLFKAAGGSAKYMTAQVISDATGGNIFPGSMVYGNDLDPDFPALDGHGYAVGYTGVVVFGAATTIRLKTWSFNCVAGDVAELRGGGCCFLVYHKIG